MTDINRMDLKQVTLAISLGETNLEAVAPEHRPALAQRIAALRDRRRSLMLQNCRTGMFNAAAKRKYGRAQ